MSSPSRLNIAATALLCLALTACGSQAGNYTPAPANAGSGSTQLTQAITLSTLPILTDTSTSTEGVFIAAACANRAVVDCANFANDFRHGLALGVKYATWDNDLASYMQGTGMNNWPAQNMVPEITWEPKMSTSNVTYVGIINGAYDTYIRKTADELKAYGHPVFLRPFHEFNGKWYSWGLANQGADSTADTNFIAAWRHVHNIFATEGATNVKFIWCFANTSVPSTKTAPWNNEAAAYPGDAYVDWIGFDAYNRGNQAYTKPPWVTFDQMISSAYSRAVAISANKPVIWAEGAANEYGDGGTKKADWVNQMFTELSSTSNPYPHLKAITWFESDTNTYKYDSMSTTPVYDAFVNDLRWTNSSGVLDFRSNGNALAQITTP
jgi:hypothetical protein